MKNLFILFSALMILSSCSTEQAKQARITEDFNLDWKFHLGDEPEALNAAFDDSNWGALNLPHDWSIRQGYQEEGTAASTGFVPGGIGWYRKTFKLSAGDEGKQISILFDGVYNNSSVWINGHFLGKRPYGYSSFSYNLSDHLNYDGTENVVAVKVDRTAYIDSRWYTGSGIYRKVQLIKKSPLHIAQWGVQITTPTVSGELAEVEVRTKLENAGAPDVQNVGLRYTILDPSGSTVAQEEVEVDYKEEKSNLTKLPIEAPQRWSVDTPNLYTLKVALKQDGKLMDETSETFGIRSFHFDANTGFSLNGKRMKIKGVNLHHDAGAVGTAVPKDVWAYRVKKLKSIGVNAIRFAHNPHAVELLEVCDEMGILVMNEAFDEWSTPKGKSLIYLGDNAAPKEASRAYPEVFNEWAERDLKDLILRDFNHPSIIMWSIGNEIEWTFPHYAKTYTDVNGPQEYYKFEPNYDSLTIKTAFDKNTGGIDSLALTAKRLANWVKEMDTTRPVTSGSVHPSVALASGYASQLDVLGFNYRAVEYDAAHKAYPNLKILGSENWGAYSEWKNCIKRDFVAGIFVWTGFAYLGEAGPWPRKGLEISFFDYAGFKTPRGHFYECLWVDQPKVYMVTTPAEESEYAFDETEGWQFTTQWYEPPLWEQLRLWDWYKVYEKWNYSKGDEIIVQAYTNCEEAELFLNGESLGKQSLADFPEDNIIKWLVPYESGELKIIGYNAGEAAEEYALNTTGEPARIELSTDKTKLNANNYDVAHITAKLYDTNGFEIKDLDTPITFHIEGAASLLAVDNGWERNVDSHYKNSVKTRNGRALAIIQAGSQSGSASIVAKIGALESERLEVLFQEVSTD